LTIASTFSSQISPLTFSKVTPYNSFLPLMSQARRNYMELPLKMSVEIFVKKMLMLLSMLQIID